MNSRPMSATSASSYAFGKTPKNLEINPKVSHYHSNGSGRDSYINFDNGGFRRKWENNYTAIHTQKMSSGEIIKPVQIHSKVVIYKSDGYGRDSYINSSCGGFYKAGQSPSFFSFNSTLRQYDPKPIIRKNDFLHQTQTFVKKEYRPLIRSLSQKQRVQSARLSQPKYILPKLVM